MFLIAMATCITAIASHGTLIEATFSSGIKVNISTIVGYAPVLLLNESKPHKALAVTISNYDNQITIYDGSCDHLNKGIFNVALPQKSIISNASTKNCRSLNYYNKNAPIYALPGTILKYNFFVNINERADANYTDMDLFVFDDEKYFENFEHSSISTKVSHYYNESSCHFKSTSATDEHQTCSVEVHINRTMLVYVGVRVEVDIELEVNISVDLKQYNVSSLDKTTYRKETISVCSDCNDQEGMNLCILAAAANGPTNCTCEIKYSDQINGSFLEMILGSEGILVLVIVSLIGLVCVMGCRYQCCRPRRTSDTSN